MQIVVLGAHRAGMSPLTRVLQLMGCRLGVVDGEADAFERRAVLSLNDELLARAEATWFDNSPQGFVAALGELGADLDERARAIVAEMDALGEPWVLKDPRFCITLPFWLRHLERPTFVVAHRNPLALAASLQKREGFPLQASLALWHGYVAAAVHHTRGLPRVVAQHDSCLRDAGAAAERLEGELTRLGVTGLSLARRDEIVALYASRRERPTPSNESSPVALSPARAALAQALDAGTFPAECELVAPPELEREFFTRERRLRTMGRATSELRVRYSRVEGANVELRQLLKRIQSEFRSAERQIGRVEERLRAETERSRELEKMGHKLTNALQRTEAQRNHASARLKELQNAYGDLEALARRARGGTGAFGRFFRRLSARPGGVPLEELVQRLVELQSTPPLLPVATEADVLFVLKAFAPLAEAWEIDEARLGAQLRASEGLPATAELAVRVGTLYSGETEYEQCKRSVGRQSYPRIEHVFHEHLGKKEALSTLMEGFLASSADILIKLDADMVLLDEDFVARVVRIFATNPDIQVVQMAMLDFFSGDLMQGINAYRQGFPWQTEQQDSLFTDRVKIDPGRRLVTWTTFADAAIHCPNPSPFQAFHFGVHRGVKVVQPGASEHKTQTAEEQLIYLEKTYEHWRTRRDPRLGFAALGFELALTQAFAVEHLTYSNPYLHERFVEFEHWDTARIDQKIEELRAAAPLSEAVAALRQHRQAAVARHTAPVNRIVMLVPHLGMFGGVNRFLYLARAFARWGVESAVAIPDDELTGTKRPTRRDDFPDVQLLPLSVASQQDWDVVICGDRSSGVLLTLPLFRARLSVVYLLNGWAHRVFNTRQIAAVRPDVLIACSSYAARQYADLAPTVVAGGVSLDLFTPHPQRSRNGVARIGAYPGRGREAKRFDDTIAACRVLRARGVAFELHVYDPVLASLSDTFPIVNHGALAPANVCKVMQELDVFVSSEEDAGWCNPAAEAMASGVPLVCTEAGTSDFAVHEETALVVPARSPEQLADGISRLLEDPELATRLRHAGLERIREFDWTNVARRLIETFRVARKDVTLRAAQNQKAKKNLEELGVLA